MRVKELIDLLKDVNPDSEVILQKDSEGNGYSPLRGVDDECVYVPECPWSGSIYSLHWTAREACMEPKEWKAMKRKPRCVVLYPIN